MIQEVQRLLSQLIALRGLQSDPGVPGTEKFVITEISESWLSQPKMFISVNDLAVEDPGRLIGPQNVFLVKGYNRATCALLVLLAASEMPNLLEAGFCSFNSLFTVNKKDDAPKGIKWIQMVSTCINRYNGHATKLCLM